MAGNFFGRNGTHPSVFERVRIGIQDSVLEDHWNWPRAADRSLEAELGPGALPQGPRAVDWWPRAFIRINLPPGVYSTLRLQDTGHSLREVPENDSFIVGK